LSLWWRASELLLIIQLHFLLVVPILSRTTTSSFLLVVLHPDTSLFFVFLCVGVLVDARVRTCVRVCSVLFGVPSLAVTIVIVIIIIFYFYFCEAASPAPWRAIEQVGIRTKTEQSILAFLLSLPV
jgi:hypothetical protein